MRSVMILRGTVLAFAAVVVAEGIVGTTESCADNAKLTTASDFADVFTAGDAPARRRPGANLAADIDRLRAAEAEHFVAREQHEAVARPAPALASTRSIVSGERPQLLFSRKDKEQTTVTPTTRFGTSSKGVAEKVRTAYLPGLQRCYRKSVDTTGGVLKLMFTVSSTGRVARPTTGGVSVAVGACIRGRMATWRFSADDRASSRSPMIAMVLEMRG